MYHRCSYVICAQGNHLRRRHCKHHYGRRRRRRRRRRRFDFYFLCWKHIGSFKLGLFTLVISFTLVVVTLVCVHHGYSIHLGTSHLGLYVSLMFVSYFELKRTLELFILFPWYCTKVLLHFQSWYCIMEQNWFMKHPAIQPSQQVWVGGIPGDLKEEVLLRQMEAAGIEPWRIKLRQSKNTSDKWAILDFKSDNLAKACMDLGSILVGKGTKISFRYSWSCKYSQKICLFVVFF